ncbi:hypothetical protein [Plantactinospora sp. KLBMP9567]|uniref:hypothetical protein n=1 Tax=Plantactinospora sp. KLBMP9567 TaxID=3085900 RepID=UPI002981B806|nr:hypothetical protein [Plantactinospora sp. KLBMP9567]MDW5323926.1 hypothetical protein [Plantactinospora sp. KLBMP9567]
MSERYVVHVPFAAPTPATARILARTAARTLARLPQVDVAEATVSAEDDQIVQSRLFCDRLLGGGRRCALRAEHQTPCTPLAPPDHLEADGTGTTDRRTSEPAR